MAFFIRKLNKIPKRILVSRTDRIGDFILSLPVFEVIKKELKIHQTVLCNEMVVPLLENNPFVDDIIPVKKDINLRNPSLDIDTSAFDALLVLVNDPVILKLLSSLKSIPIRIGPLSKPLTLLQFTHPVIQKRSASIKNEAEYNLEMLQIFNIAEQSLIKPRLYLTDNEVQVFRSTHSHLLKRLNDENKWVVLHPGMKGSALNMNQQFYRKLLKGLLRRGYQVWLTGSGNNEFKENQNLIDSVAPAFKENTINIADQFSLRDLAIMISLNSVFIGPSTGPTHLANAVKTPLVSFYPPIQVQSAIRWAPFLAKGHLFSPSVPCGQKYTCIKEKCPYFFCMDTIQVETVLNRVAKLSKP